MGCYSHVYVVGEHNRIQSVQACIFPLDDLFEIVVEEEKES
jgi:hypothetical protein